MRHKHTLSGLALWTALLLALPAQARPRVYGEIKVTGPGGEAALHTGQNQVQVWSCRGGKLKTCTIRSEGGGIMTPSGRKNRDGSREKLTIDFRRDEKLAMSRRHR